MVCDAHLPDSLPAGASVVVMTASAEQPADRERLQGLMEALPGENRLSVVKIELAQEPAAAQGQLQEGLSGVQGGGALIALRSEHAAVIHALLAAGRLPKDLAIVCADDSLATLQTIERGQIQRSVIPRPAEIAFHAMRILAAVLRGDSSALPKDRRFLVPPLIIERSNVDVFLDRAGVALTTTSASTSAGAANESSPGEAVDDDPAW